MVFWELKCLICNRITQHSLYSNEHIISYQQNQPQSLVTFFRCIVALGDACRVYMAVL